MRLKALSLALSLGAGIAVASVINSQAIGRNEVMLPQNLVALLDIFGVLAFILPGFTSLAVDQATGSAFKYANKQLVLPVYPKCVR